MGLVSKICRGSYIAGCNKEYMDKCCESMEDHIGSMLKRYRSLDSSVKNSIRKAYEIYIETAIETIKAKAANSVNLSTSNISQLIRCDPVELVIALHDLGKCTKKNQERLRERCTAPCHEIISAASLYAFSLSIDRSFGLIMALPHIMAILLHHHSIRSVRDLFSKDKPGATCESNLYLDNDLQNIVECAKISLKVSCPDLVPYIDNPMQLSKLPKYISDLPNILTSISNMLPIVFHSAYRVAVMITGIISILDRYAASVNRSCGGISEEDLDRDVKEYLKRREAFIEASRALNIGGG